MAHHHMAHHHMAHHHIAARTSTFDVPADIAIPALHGFELRHDGREVLTATYWDTPDLALLRAGHALCHRLTTAAEGGWTLELAEPGRGAGRRQRTFDGGPGAVPAAVRALLKAVLGGGALAPVATLTTARRRQRLDEPQAGAIIELADDRIASTIGGCDGPSLRRVSLELRHGPGDAFERAVTALRDAGARVAGPAPELASVLPSPDRARSRAARAAPSTVADLVRTALGDGLDSLLERDPLLRCGAGEADVHKARVATRRLRSVLRSLSTVVRADQVDGLRRELAWLGALLGAVRDTDVLRALLHEAVGDLDEIDPAGPAELDRLLQDQRRVAELTLLDAMGSARYDGLLDRLRRLSHEPPLAAGVDADAPAAPVARAAVRHDLRRVDKAVRRLSSHPLDDELHELRKRAKRARYAAELAAPLTGARTSKLATRLTKLQDALGEHQDAVTLSRWLRDLDLDRSSPIASFTAGRMDQLLRRRTAGATRWRRAWRKARRLRPAG